MKDTTRDPEYFMWLADFGFYCDQLGVKVNASAHHDILYYYFKSKRENDAVLKDYIKFKIRWNALQQEGLKNKTN